MPIILCSRLYDEGHDIVGVDIAPVAAKEFFEESKMTFTTHPIDGVTGTIYKVLVYVMVQ